MIQPGKYRARALEGALGKAKTGTEQIEVLFQLLDVAETLTWRGYFTPAAEERTMESLQLAGWNWIGLGFAADAPEVSLAVEHEEGQDGRTYARVRWVNAPASVKPKQPLTEDEIAALTKRLGIPMPAAQTAGPAFPSAVPAGDFDPNSEEDSGLPF